MRLFEGDNEIIRSKIKCSSQICPLGDTADHHIYGICSSKLGSSQIQRITTSISFVTKEGRMRTDVIIQSCTCSIFLLISLLILIGAWIVLVVCLLLPHWNNEFAFWDEDVNVVSHGFISGHGVWAALLLRFRRN